jgi:pimeloyl-ACP methyl ester carboxylesterase
MHDWCARIIDRSDATYTEIDTEGEGARIHGYLTGSSDKPLLFFVHGWSSNALLWDIGNHLHQLKDHYRIFLLDVPGQPNLGDRQSLPVRSDAYARYLKSAVDYLGAEKAHFIGISFGAFLLMKLAQYYPGSMAPSVLMAPAGFVRAQLFSKLPYYFVKTSRIPSSENIERFIRKILLGSATQIPDEHFGLLVDMFRCSFAGFNPGAQFPYTYSKSELANIDVPFLLLQGEEDRLFSARKVVNRAERDLPSLVRAEILPGLGHALGNIPELIGRIDRFIEEQSSIV